VTSLRAGDRGIVVRLSTWARDLFLLQDFQNASEAHQACFSMDKTSTFFRSKEAGTWRWPFTFFWRSG